MITWQPTDSVTADRLDCFIATGTAAVIAAITAASASAAAAKISSNAQKHAAAVQAQAQADATAAATRSSSEATAAQAKAESDALAASTKSNEDTLQFQKDQANRDQAYQETNRQADYGQWRARESRIGTLGQALGLPARDIPDYVPLPGSINGSQSTGAPAAVNPANMPTSGEVNWTAAPDQLAAQLTDYYKKRGVAASEVPYWVQHAQELVARGQQLNDPGYADKRLAASEVFGGGGGQATPGAPATPGKPGTINSTMPYSTPLTAAYQAPRAAVPGSIRAFAA